MSSERLNQSEGRLSRDLRIADSSVDVCMKGKSAIGVAAPASSDSVSVGTGSRSSLFEIISDWRSALFQNFTWIAGGRMVTAVGGVAKYVIFARLLRPTDFGIVGAAYSVKALFGTLSNFHLDRALVPQVDEVEPYLDTMWVAALVQALLVAVPLIVLAKPLATFLNIERYYRVFWAGAVLAFVQALKSPAASARIYRDLSFHILFALNAAEVFAGFIFGLMGILAWRDWRGLVLADIAAQGARAALSYWYYPYWPRIRFDRARARRMFSYGRWVTFRMWAEYAVRNLDKLTIGHIMGAHALGEYQMAFRVGELPASEFAFTAGILSFSTVARSRRRGAVSGRFLKVSVLATVALGLAYWFLMSVYGGKIISVTVGAKWLGCLPPLRLLCLAATAQGVLTLGAEFLDGMNTPQAAFRLKTASAIMFVLLVYPLTLWFGTIGTAVAAVVSAALPLPFLYILYRQVNPPRRQLA
ncbi:MAG TPA: oligosaccharide flippase family protein [Candidatus Binataceae bacterium]